MKILVFDTETTGLPKDKAKVNEIEKWPYIIQLSYLLYDDSNNKILFYYDDIIKLNNNINISDESIKIHGITRAKSNRKGVNINSALTKFNETLLEANIIVGHNISFDIRMLMVEFKRNNMQHLFSNSQGYGIKEYCTMKKSVNICKLLKTNSKGNTYYKYPRLSELHFTLFNKNPKGLHDSMGDILICLRCYYKIINDKDILKECNLFKKLFNLYCE
tara:strand:+ start:187 stop:840 length:654 start_codon:yes stop_codon:yes gene_type:complete